jgi:hypothetical protein
MNIRFAIVVLCIPLAAMMFSFFVWLTGDRELSSPRSEAVAFQFAKGKGERYLERNGKRLNDFSFLPNRELMSDNRSAVYFFVSRKDSECLAVTIDLMSDEVWYSNRCPSDR